MDPDRIYWKHPSGLKVKDGRENGFVSFFSKMKWNCYLCKSLCFFPVWVEMEEALCYTDKRRAAFACVLLRNAEEGSIK